MCFIPNARFSMICTKIPFYQWQISALNQFKWFQYSRRKFKAVLHNLVISSFVILLGSWFSNVLNLLKLSKYGEYNYIYLVVGPGTSGDNSECNPLLRNIHNSSLSVESIISAIIRLHHLLVYYKIPDIMPLLLAKVGSKATVNWRSRSKLLQAAKIYK